MATKTLFLNYRRSDTGPAAQRLAADLRRRFAPEDVFLDAGIQAGGHWPSTLRTAIAAADVVFVLIGKGWLLAQDPDTGRRRLDQPGDWVHDEIETALARQGAGCVVGPVLVEGASMPTRKALPPSIAGLAEIKAVVLRDGGDWEHDVDRLIDVLLRAGFASAERRARSADGGAEDLVADEADNSSPPRVPLRRARPRVPSPWLPAAASCVAAATLVGLAAWRFGELGVVLAALPVLGVALVLGFRGRPLLTLDDGVVIPSWLAEIPGGTFLMGSSANDEGAADHEKPQHPVTIAPCLLWKTPLTRAEYRAVMPADTIPREWTEANDDRLPATYVDFLTALRCCNALSAKAQLAPYYEISDDSIRLLGGEGYRLPSEAEWEYACRAGTTTQYWSGDTEADLARVGWYRENSGVRVHAVGEKPANAYGLHDTHGNVWEWCEDEWHGSYEGAPADGRAWLDSTSASSVRVLRGGCFDDSAGGARSAYRSVSARPGRRDAIVGFRPARSVVHP